jgi:hypothetical protein
MTSVRCHRMLGSFDRVVEITAFDHTAFPAFGLPAIR